MVIEVYPPKNLIPELHERLALDPLVAQYVAKCPPEVQIVLAFTDTQNVWRWKPSTKTWAVQHVPLHQIWREALKQVFDGGRVRNDEERRQYVEIIREEERHDGRCTPEKIVSGLNFSDDEACVFLHLQDATQLAALADRAGVRTIASWMRLDLRMMRTVREGDPDFE